jgi:acetyl-CoA carboxylase biotin carboxyl carrier protein
MDEKMIAALMAQFEQSSAVELELTSGEDHLRLKKARHSQPAATKKPATATPVPAAGTPVQAPLVGIAYLRPAPDQPVFKQVGEHVTAGEVVCVIESMKMMNEVTSPVSGVIQEVLIANESLVEYHQDLFLITEEADA